VVLAARRRADSRPSHQEARHRAGADDRRRALHAVHRRMSRRVRDRAGADGRRHLSREHDTREDRRAGRRAALSTDMANRRLLMTFPVTATSHTLAEYRARGGYTSLEKALKQMAPQN